MSKVDSLTGGRNEAGMQEQYEALACQGTPCFTLAVLNIKNFRLFNVQYGRAAADDVLCTVARLIAGALEEGESWGRLHADEFVLLLRSGTRDAVICRITDMVHQLYELEDTRIHHNIGLSFGIYLMEKDAPDFYTAVERADLCRVRSQHYRVLNSSYEFYSEAWTEKYLRDHETIQAAVQALQEGGFVPYVQPKVQLADRHIIGGEVLMRWPIGPNQLRPLPEFLPLLEETGLIREVDRYLFGQVCRAYDACLKQDLSMVPISFNVSRSYFEDANFLQEYEETFHGFDIPRSLIEFELMESISLDDTRRLFEVVDQLKKAGFRCSLDDFGSGYSSFHVLLNIDIDTLKIDGGFFRKPLTAKDRIVLRTVMDLAHQLGYSTVAEGVERQEDVDFLKELGCDVIQGFYFYRPMPLQDFLDLVEQQNRLSV